MAEGRYCSAVSPEARLRIVNVVLRTRSKRELARLLGVTAPAVIKYSRGRAAPRDEVLCRIIEIADDDELEEIKKIIVEDLAATLRDFLYSMQERGILGEEDLYSLEGVIQAVRLSLLGQRSPAPLAR